MSVNVMLLEICRRWREELVWMVKRFLIPSSNIDWEISFTV